MIKLDLSYAHVENEFAHYQKEVSHYHKQLVEKTGLGNDYVGWYTWPTNYDKTEFEKVKEGSMWLYQVLRQNLNIPVLGPEEPAISRIRNEYIRTIMIKIPAESSLLNTKKTILKMQNSFDNVPQYRAIKMILNVDY